MSYNIRQSLTSYILILNKFIDKIRYSKKALRILS